MATGWYAVHSNRRTVRTADNPLLLICIAT